MDRERAAPGTGPEVEVLMRETPFRGYFRIDKYTLRHQFFDRPGWSEAYTREVFERGHATAVLPYDPIRDEVVLIEQFRAGALAAGWHPWLLEVVAGIIDGDESPEDVARREIREEAGLDIRDLRLVARYLVSPGGTSETCSLYCGLVSTNGAGGVHGVDREHEHIKVHVLPAGDAIAMAEDGRMDNATGLIALLWLSKNRDTLRRAWQNGIAE